MNVCIRPVCSPEVKIYFSCASLLGLVADIHFIFIREDRPKSFSWLDVSVFVCALGDFLVFFAPVLRQIARYPPHRTSGNALKTHPKSAHDNFKQFLNKTV